LFGNRKGFQPSNFTALAAQTAKSADLDVRSEDDMRNSGVALTKTDAEYRDAFNAAKAEAKTTADEAKTTADDSSQPASSLEFDSSQGA
jgi:hypothetical protein